MKIQEYLLAPLGCKSLWDDTLNIVSHQIVHREKLKLSTAKKFTHTKKKFKYIDVVYKFTFISFLSVFSDQLNSELNSQISKGKKNLETYFHYN